MGKAIIKIIVGLVIGAGLYLAGSGSVTWDGVDVRNGTPRQVDIKAGPASSSGHSIDIG